MEKGKEEWINYAIELAKEFDQGANRVDFYYWSMGDRRIVGGTRKMSQLSKV